MDIYINQGDDKGDRKEKKLTLSSTLQHTRDTGRAYSQTETYLDISSAYIASLLSIDDAMMLLHPIKTSHFIKYSYIERKEDSRNFILGPNQFDEFFQQRTSGEANQNKMTNFSPTNKF